MNLPNKLTIFRIILVPVMVIFAYINLNAEFLGIPVTSWILALIFAISSYTDHLDGMLARKNNQITDFGKFADPLADKILVLSAMLILVEQSKLPAWIPIIVITREFAVSGYRLIAAEKKGEVIAASIWGKIKTATQMVGIIGLFLSNYAFLEFVKNWAILGTEQYIINLVSSILIAISVATTIFSGYDYLKNFKELLK